MKKLTKQQCIEMLSKDGCKIVDIDPSQVSEELCFVAINENPFVIYLISNKHKTEKMCTTSLLLIKKNHEAVYIDLINRDSDKDNLNFFGNFRKESMVRSMTYFLNKLELSTKIQNIK